MKNSKQQLVSSVSYMSEAQADFVNRLISLGCNLSKGSMIEILRSTGDIKNVDSAMPMDYVKKVQEILPDFQTWANVYSYDDPNTYGAVKNLPETLILRLAEVMTEPNDDQPPKLASGISDQPYGYKAYTLLFTLAHFASPASAVHGSAKYYLSDASREDKERCMQYEGGFLSACLKGDFCAAYREASEGNREALRYGLIAGTIEL